MTKRIVTRRVDSPRSDRAMLSTELALLMPALVLFALVALFAVQVQRHGARTGAAADAAARAAALHGSPTSVESLAHAAASQVCLGDVSDVAVDWVDPSAADLRPGRVAIQLTCTEQFRGLAALLGAGERSARASAVASLEYWRVSE